MSNSLFQSLPSELIDRILLQLDPIDLSSLSQTSSHARAYLYSHSPLSHHLFHLIFLKYFDPPLTSTHEPVMGRRGEIEGEVLDQLSPQRSPSDSIDWRALVQRRIKLRQTLAPTQDDLLCTRLSKNYPGRDQMITLYQDIFDLLNSSSSSSISSSSRNVEFLNQIFHQNTSAQFRILHFSGQNFHTQVLFDHRPCLNDPLVSAAAELHTKFGLTELDKSRPRSRGVAREACYALLNNHPENFYGPVHARSISQSQPTSHTPATGVLTTPIVIHSPQDQITSNQLTIGPNWADIDWPILSGLSTSRPYTQIMNPAYLYPAPPWPPTSSLEKNDLDLNRFDWAGVEGKWLRVVCFLDYRDLHAYNFYGANPRPTLDDHNEAIRLMTLDLKVVSIGCKPDSDPTHPTPPCLHTNCRPPIYFRGTSVSNSSTTLVHATSLVRGCVSETSDGEVRWSVVSTFEGGDRWSSEGIQVGGIRAKWGVVGVWTDVNRGDVEGPAGPFYFFKVAY
ncbi:hypothetical protein DFH28DRAFT_1119775 [Melampsora americana]|nr:hypothetical protein DFH28DRAFT_1119775 [Melampsora americana]